MKKLIIHIHDSNSDQGLIRDMAGDSTQEQINEVVEDMVNQLRNNVCSGCGDDHDPENCTTGFNTPKF